MDPLTAAAELCGLVRRPNLAAWLGVAPSAPPDELRTALQRRRRALQGMLANPKHAREATFVVRSYPALEAALSRLDEHIEDMTRRAEAAHLPALELMIDGVLAAGPLTPIREEQLLRGVLDLGVREETFRRLLEERVGREPVRAVERGPVAAGPDTLYALLGLGPTATEDEVHEAAARLIAAISGADRASESRRHRLQIAESVLGHPSGRRLYDRLNGIAPPPPPTPDLYAILNVRPSAPPLELEIAYQARLSALSPDDPERHRLEVAWLVLRNSSARARYDSAFQPVRARPVAVTRLAPPLEPDPPPVRRIPSAVWALAVLTLGGGVGGALLVVLALAYWLTH